MSGEAFRPSTGQITGAGLLVVLSALGGAAVRSNIGAGTSNVSTPGTGVVVALSGDAGTLDAAGAADGSVVALVGGLPTLTTISSGSGLPDAAGASDGAVLSRVGGSSSWVAPSSGPTIGSGTYASRPASPSVGDMYAVTSGVRKGTVYRCLVAGTWTVAWINYAGSVRPLYRWDTERLEGESSVTAWADEERGNTLGPAGTSASAITISTNGTSGMPVAVWNGSAVALRAVHPGPLRGFARSLLVVMYSTSASGSHTYAGWGGTSSSTGFWLSSSGSSFLLEGGGAWQWSGGSVPTTTTPLVALVTYDGTTFKLSTTTLSTSPSWTTAVSQAATLVTSGYTAATTPPMVPPIIVGASDPTNFTTNPANFTLMHIAAYASDITSSRDGIVSDLATREGL